MTNEKLIELALEARKAAYAPYSRFRVGAALEAADGSVYTGCNIENATYTPTVCAERVAFFKAISEGHRTFRRIAIVGGMDDDLSDIAPPCGVCRQVMREFCGDGFEVLLSDGRETMVVTLADLLPTAFSPDNLSFHSSP